MNRNKFLLLVFLCSLFSESCKNVEGAIDTSSEKVATPFMWEAANVYFLLTDRFHNGDPSNDVNFERTKETAVLRGFKGGDLKGITQKLEEGYFEDLGVNAIWMTPFFEQVRGGTDEGTGVTYAFHGYWPRDFTALDPNFGTYEDLKTMIETAHSKGIRVVMDVIVNHIGPVTEKDPVWPEEWVREDPTCQFNSYETTITCTLVDNLPDIKTENETAVSLPPFLVDKWKAEGRYEEEMAELDAFFERTQYPRAAKYYVIKWICDYVKELGLDGFRLDTAKHLEESVSKELKKQGQQAFAKWKENNPSAVLDDNDFWMVGEVYGYNISSGRKYDFGDKKVDFYENGLNSLINFEFIPNSNSSYEEIFARYDRLLNEGELNDYGVLNYLSSHDDGNPFDKDRSRAMESGTKLLLAPGGAQIYYGDESSRNLIIEGAQGDATLREVMNWDEIKTGATRSGHNVKAVLEHWQKLGRFRRDHPAIGAGRHQMLSESPYVFKRDIKVGAFEESVVIGLDLPKGEKTISTKGAFKDGTKVNMTSFYWRYYKPLKIFILIQF